MKWVVPMLICCKWISANTTRYRFDDRFGSRSVFTLFRALLQGMVEGVDNSSCHIRSRDLLAVRKDFPSFQNDGVRIGAADVDSNNARIHSGSTSTC